MYNSCKRISYLKGLTNDWVSFSLGPWNRQQIRKTSGLLKKKPEAAGEVSEEISFSNLLQQRQEQARRSVVFQIKSPNDDRKLIPLCRNFGNIKKIFHYQLKNSKFILIEMEREEDLNNFVKWSHDVPDNVNRSSQFLVFDKNKYNTTENNDWGNIECEETRESGRNINTFFSTHNNLKQSTLNEIIMRFYKTLTVSEHEMRLRFLMCRQIECLFAGILPNATIYPFGSSVTGFGVNGCDMDLAVLDQHSKNQGFMLIEKNGLYFDRSKSQAHLGLVAEILRCFLSSCKGVVFIQNARVPIVKFRNEFTMLDCDLSMYNSHGVSMCQIVYTLINLDERVKLLVFVMKLWASNVGITSKINWGLCTGFTITLLTIFFLQQNFKSSPIIPPWRVFPSGKSFLLTESEVLVGLKDFKENVEENQDSLEELLISFFSFYSKFDFQKYGISLRSGTTIENKEKFPLYIENPLMPGVNASKNVHRKGVVRFRECCTIAKQITEIRQSSYSIFKQLLGPEYYRTLPTQKSNVDFNKFFCKMD